MGSWGEPLYTDKGGGGKGWANEVIIEDDNVKLIFPRGKLNLLIRLKFSEKERTRMNTFKFSASLDIYDSGILGCSTSLREAAKKFLFF